MINQVRNRLGTKGRQTNHLLSQVVRELVLITCLKRYDGMKVGWDEGMTGGREGGTSKPMRIVYKKV